MPAELIPILFRGRTYENLKSERVGTDESLSIISDGSVSKLLDKKGNINVIIKDNNHKVSLPIIELARALFLHNVHLVRAALRPNGLRGLADSDEEKSISTIRFSMLSDYPSTTLKQKNARSHLIWLMFDQGARKSFNSIYDSYCLSRGEEWDFDFKLPDLKGWTFTFTGKKRLDKLFLVDEITSWKNPHFYYPKAVEVHHPKYHKAIPELKIQESNTPYIKRQDPSPTLDLLSTPKLGARKIEATGVKFSFEFVEKINSNLISDKERPKVTVLGDANVETKKELVGVGHARVDGNACEFNPIGVKSDGVNKTIPEMKKGDETDRFDLFEEAIKLLAQKEGYSDAEIECYQLPVAENKNQHVENLITGERRVCYVAKFNYLTIPLVMVEVDVVGLKEKHRLSSRIFGFNKDSNDNFKIIMQACSDKGVRWNQSIIELYSSVDGAVKHPSKNIVGDIDDKKKAKAKYKEVWGNAIHKAVTQIIEQAT